MTSSPKSRSSRRETPTTPPAAPQPPDPTAPPLAATDGALAFTVGAPEAGMRLDRLLSERLSGDGPTLSRTRLKALIESGRLTVDGAPADDPAVKARPGQSLRLVVPPPVAAAPAPEPIPLAIVYEDDCLVVIDKPAGLVVHPAAGHESGTLVNALLAHCGASLSGVGGVRRPGLVHRLDKDTSGLMVVAKTDAAHRGLAELFADHGRTLGLMREYVAVVWDAPERRSGVVRAPIGRHPHARDRQAVVRTGGRDAATHWRVERIFAGADARRPLATLVRCRLETGRTHQIRVHMASIGHPLVGDALYGAGYQTKAERLTAGAREALDALGRQALHAASLGFPHPITGEPLAFESPPPADMARLIGAMGAPS